VGPIPIDQIDKSRFIEAFKQFNKDLRAYNGSQFVSFSTGVPAAWENYKPIIRRLAVERLQADNWMPGDVGSGRILMAVINAIEIKESAIVRNNLVPWEPRHNRPSETAWLKEELGAGPDRQRFERHIFDLFHRRSEPEKVLTDLVELIGKRYGLIAYIFYVFDDTRFLPIAPKTFDEAFEAVGISLRTSGRCSWDNYREYVEAIRSVQVALVDWIGIKDTTLIDAHSYLWLLIRLPQENQQREQHGLRRPDDLKMAMIKVAQGVFNRVASANGQLVERSLKNKELLGFSSREAFYDFLCRMWEEQDGRCRLTGLPMLLPEKNRTVTDLVASIDRIDSSGQYSPDNIQLTCWFANRWKGSQADADFQALLEIVRRGDDALADYLRDYGSTQTD